MRTVIFDIDGTLADCSHRQSYAQAKEWDNFHSLCLKDSVIKNVADLLVSMASICNVVLLTGMNERYRHLRRKWLTLSGLDGLYEDLLMRGDQDFRPDAEMKWSALVDRFGTPEGVLENVWFVVDDKDSVVEVLRNHGLTVLQPAVSGY